jgi:hypothetical protein
MLSEGIHLRELDVAIKNEHEAVKRIFIEAEDILTEACLIHRNILNN